MREKGDVIVLSALREALDGAERQIRRALIHASANLGETKHPREVVDDVIDTIDAAIEHYDAVRLRISELEPTEQQTFRVPSAQLEELPLEPWWAQ